MWCRSSTATCRPTSAASIAASPTASAVPIASQIGSESGKWRSLHRQPIFAAVSPYGATPEAVFDAGKQLKAQGAAAILLDCIGFTERHRQALLPLDLPVILSNAVAAKALSELLGG